MIQVVSVFLILLHLAASQVATLTEAPAYASLRPCAKGCFYLGAYKGPDKLADHIGCAIRSIDNGCLCRPDLQAEADSYLRSCVNDLCSNNALDVTSAVSIYDAYCTGAGFLRATNVPASTTSGSSASSSSSRSQSQPTTLQSSSASSGSTRESGSQPTTSGTPTPATTSASTGGGGGGKALGTGEIVGIVVGVLGVIATSIGAWISYKAIKGKKQVAPQQPHMEMSWR